MFVLCSPSHTIATLLGQLFIYDESYVVSHSISQVHDIFKTFFELFKHTGWNKTNKPTHFWYELAKP